MTNPKALPVKPFRWKRFWIPRGEDWPEDNGFLLDPDSDLAKYQSNRPVDFSAIRVKPVLILLGEAGIGKSIAIRQEHNETQQIAKEQNYLCAFHDLGEYGDENRLIRDVFESDSFATYRTGSAWLYLFLDSFDECRLGIPHLSKLLTSQLQKYVSAPERLFLRIACRSSEWPQGLEDAVKGLWRDKGGNNIGVFELCPLREQDVLAKAQETDLDGEAFLSAVHEREVESLASHPKTLDYLLKEFRLHRDLPRRRAEIFEKGILHLCEEHQQRVEAGRGGDLSSGTRMHIAGRIAAALILGNRGAVWRGDTLDKLPEDISLEELVGYESTQAGTLVVDVSALAETLTVSGLFRQRGPQRLHFVHQSDAEFLAAWYLVRSGMEVEQMLMLLRHPDDRHIVPQLHQTASWLASLNDPMFQYIVEIEPEILLAGDIFSSEHQYKQRLVANLLSLYQEGKLYDWIEHHKLRKLSYPGLADQLLPYVKDDSKRERARRLAIEIVTACHVTGLQNVLAEIALNVGEPYALRIEATEAVVEVGDTTVKGKLRPLAYGEAGEDPEDRLKGAALEALWPEHLTVKELFQLLTPRQNRHFIGGYSNFIHRELPSTLRPEHLPESLRWVKGQLPRWDIDYDLQRLVDDIMSLAWEHLEAPGVLEAFSSTALILFKRHDGLFNRRGRRNDVDRLADREKRHRFLEGMIPLVGRKDVHLLGWHVAREDDVTWLLERCKTNPSAHEHRIVADLLAHLVHFHSTPKSINAVLDACGCHAQQPDLILRKASRHLVLPIRLKSKKAKELRQHSGHEQRRKKRNLRKPLPYTRAQYVAKQLELLERGSLNAWIGLLQFLTLDEASQTYHSSLDGVTKTLGWDDADALTRDRIMSGALQYLDQAQPYIGGHLTGDEPIKLGDSTAYIALELLAEVFPDQLVSRASSFWQKWSGVIVVNPNYRSGQTHDQLLQYVSRHAEPQMLVALSQLINREGKSEQGFSRIFEYDCVWSDRLAEIIFNKAQKTEFSEKTRVHLFDFLLRYAHPETISFLRAIVTGAKEKKEKLFALRLLCTKTPSDSWETLNKLLYDDVNLAKEVMLYVVDDLGRSLGPYADLEEARIADLYIWFEREFPHTEDPKHEGVYSPTTRDHVAEFRDALLANLSERGTVASCAALQLIIDAFPGRDWLKWTLRNAQRKTRMTTWHAPTVQEIYAIAKDRRSSLIRSESEMLDVIIESAQRLQEELRGETPLAPFLWDESTSKPKNENRLSDFVKRHLLKDLNRRSILVNREVEVHNWSGKGRGASTDLFVQAISPEKEVFTVVVEIKGCWNDNLHTDMDAQLKQKYLLEAHHRYGIYLVGWFGTEYCKRCDLKNLCQKLERQALQLSHNELIIKSYVLDVSLKTKSHGSTKRHAAGGLKRKKRISKKRPGVIKERKK